MDSSRKILFMDDEIASAPLLRQAVQSLEDSGFEVTQTSRMSEAMDAFYQSYYHIFILDIDMSHVADPWLADGSDDGEPSTQDGGDVARFLRSLDNQTHVIFFSARGKNRHWFLASELHVFGYVFKNSGDLLIPDSGPIPTLVRLAEEASRLTSPRSFLPRPLDPPKKALLWADPSSRHLPPPSALSLLRSVLPDDWQISFFDQKTPQAASSAFLADPSSFGLVLATSDLFSGHPRVMDALRTLCLPNFQPHTLFACLGEDNARDIILSLVNFHPFRILDLSSPDASERLSLAIADAVRLYGQPERLFASPSSLRRLKLHFSEPTLDSILDPDPDDDFGFAPSSDPFDDSPDSLPSQEEP